MQTSPIGKRRERGGNFSFLAQTILKWAPLCLLRLAPFFFFSSSSSFLFPPFQIPQGTFFREIELGTPEGGGRVGKEEEGKKSWKDRRRRDLCLGSLLLSSNGDLERKRRRRAQEEGQGEKRRREKDTSLFPSLSLSLSPSSGASKLASLKLPLPFLLLLFKFTTPFSFVSCL